MQSKGKIGRSSKQKTFTLSQCLTEIEASQTIAVVYQVHFPRLGLYYIGSRRIDSAGDWRTYQTSGKTSKRLLKAGEASTWSILERVNLSTVRLAVEDKWIMWGRVQHRDRLLNHADSHGNSLHHLQKRLRSPAKAPNRVKESL